MHLNIIDSWIFKLVLVLIIEIVLYLFYRFLNKSFTGSRLSFYSVLKGVLERLFITAGLIWGVQGVLMLFGAIKLGTRLDEDSRTKISNDYFFLGNIISAIAAIGYYRFLL